MTIAIGKKEKAPESAIDLIYEWERDNCAWQILRAWEKSEIRHAFQDEGRFKEAVRRNRKILKYKRHEINSLFAEGKYWFSTKAPNSKETFYFKYYRNGIKQTGRLRQQHPKGPLAQIDEHTRTHIFPKSEQRLTELDKCLDKWKHRKGRLPRFSAGEKQLRVDRYHIEFCDGKRRKVHKSRGRVKFLKRSVVKKSVRSALEEVLGIAPT